jgi:methyltransferase (TIGR00027 family)
MPSSAADDKLHNVSDTALWVAHYRAEESERPDALFRDPYAQRLAGERGRRIAEAMGATSKYTRWTLVIRTVVIDRFITTAVAAGIDTVLNLGAGLDSRPYRMALPGSLRWIEVDHPQIIDHKEKLLAAEQPRCRLERVRLDLADRGARQALFAEINRTSQRTLVLTEGVLPYLTPDQVSDLAADIHDCPHFGWWIAEYMAKEVYRHINNRQRMERMKNAPFLFFPDDWLGFFRARGWAEQETKYLGEETVRLNRRPPAPWWAIALRPLISAERFAKFKRMTGYTLFARVG